MLRVLVMGVACGLALVACSSQPTPTRDRVQAALVTSGLARDEARCATTQLFRVLTPGQLRDLAEHGSGALPDKASTALSTALAKCTPSPSSLPAPATTAPSASAPTSKP